VVLLVGIVQNTRAGAGNSADGRTHGTPSQSPYGNTSRSADAYALQRVHAPFVVHVMDPRPLLMGYCETRARGGAQQPRTQNSRQQTASHKRQASGKPMHAGCQFARRRRKLKHALPALICATTNQ
jgi:hypothetical protein